MDQRARVALEEVVRQTVAADLDAVLAEVAALRRELVAVRCEAGLLPTARLARHERQQQVAAMREQGMSLRMIALRVGVHRVTIASDLRELGMRTPPATVGIDGVTRRHRGPATT